MGSTTETSASRRDAQPLGRLTTRRAVHPAVRRRRLRPVRFPMRWAPIPAAPSASLPPSAASPGIKPTYGTVSRYGLIAYASSLDQIGPLARTAADCAAVLDLLHGQDARDAHHSGCADGGTLAGADWGRQTGMQHRRAGRLLRQKVWMTDVRRGGAGRRPRSSRSSGAEVETFSLPGMVKYAVPAYYIIACAEASSNLSRFDGVKYGYRAERLRGSDRPDAARPAPRASARRCSGASCWAPSCCRSGYYDAYYKKALQVKALIKKAFDEAF